MLDDRDYMRRNPRYQLQWSATVVIIAINVIVFILVNLLDYRSVDSVYRNLALSVEGMKHGYFWQLISFQFLHALIFRNGIFHLLGNCFAIYIFGRAVEEAIGAFSFLRLYLAGGVAGGLLQMAAGAFWPEHFGQSVVGASAGACALLASFCALFPQRALGLFFLPIELKAST